MEICYAYFNPICLERGSKVPGNIRMLILTWLKMSKRPPYSLIFHIDDRVRVKTDITLHSPVVVIVGPR